MPGHTEAKTVICIGASVRAVAFAAIRDGWRPYCADLFADRDLQTWASVSKIPASQYPQGLVRWLQESAPPGPVLYTGRLERYPQVLAQVQEQRDLWGNPASVVRAVRDPGQLAAAVQLAGLPFADWQNDPSGLPRDGSWLVKFESGVIRWYGQSLRSRARYYQRYVPGQPASAVYLADGTHCRFLGATEQLIGCHWLQAREFQWCGNIGPLPCCSRLTEHLQRLGQALTRHFGLRGVFGVDFILQEELPWLVEINPRYPASLEVLELTTGCPWFSAHAAIFMTAQQAGLSANPGGPRLPAADILHEHQAIYTACHCPCVGKAILYTAHAFVFRLGDFAKLGEILTPSGLFADVAFADVPQESTVIPRHAPILTLIARGSDRLDTLTRLQTISAELYAAWRSAPKPQS